MNFINHLLDYFKKPKEKTEELSPNGTCPVCWGHQEYDAKIRTIYKDKQIDVKNHRNSYLKSKKFVVEHIDGIKHREGAISSCPTCAGNKINNTQKYKNTMDTKKPIKRHEALKPLSRQHHFGLLFSWKLRKGFSKNIAIERIKAYADWFFEAEIQPHFQLEEKHIFPILEKDNPLIKRALKEHRRINRLFSDAETPEKSLNLLEEELQAHIRFEERTLFNEIQKVATPEELEIIEDIHQEPEEKEEYADQFWEK
jgi:hemerythrin-like domain-containing protein